MHTPVFGFTVTGYRSITSAPKSITRIKREKVEHCRIDLDLDIYKLSILGLLERKIIGNVLLSRVKLRSGYFR